MSEEAEKPKAGLLRSSALVGGMTMISRVLGLLRDIVIAAFVGASANADAFFVAFKIPNFLRRLFAEGAFSQAFVPVLADYKEEGMQTAVRGLVDRVPHPTDSRAVLVSATDEGLEVVSAIYPILYRRLIGPFLSPYSDEEVDALGDLMGRQLL